MSNEVDPATRQDLIDALALLRERGWTQGTNVDENGCVCTFGALLNAIAPGATEWPLNSDHDTAVRLLSGRRALENQIGRRISGWNDETARTQADVEAMYERTIASLS